MSNLLTGERLSVARAVGPRLLAPAGDFVGDAITLAMYVGAFTGEADVLTVEAGPLAGEAGAAAGFFRPMV